MLNIRSGHRSINYENIIYHIGGYGHQQIERWVMNDTEIRIEPNYPVLRDWVQSEMFFVSKNYFEACYNFE